MLYKHSINCCRREIRLAKRKYEECLARNFQTDPKAYNNARSRMKVKEYVGPLSDTNNELVADEQVSRHTQPTVC